MSSTQRHEQQLEQMLKKLPNRALIDCAEELVNSTTVVVPRFHTQLALASELRERGLIELEHEVLVAAAGRLCLAPIEEVRDRPKRWSPSSATSRPNWFTATTTGV